MTRLNPKDDDIEIPSGARRPVAPTVQRIHARDQLFGVFATGAALMTVLHLKQLNVSKLGSSGLDLLAIIATLQIGQGLIGGRCSDDIGSPTARVAAICAARASGGRPKTARPQRRRKGR